MKRFSRRWASAGVVLILAGVVVAIGSALPVIAQRGQSGQNAPPIPLDKIKLPAGFHISVFAEGLRGPRSLAGRSRRPARLPVTADRRSPGGLDRCPQRIRERGSRRPPEEPLPQSMEPNGHLRD